MFFKKPTFYRIGKIDVDALEAALANCQFTDILPDQTTSFGWAPVFEDQMMFSSHKHLLLKFMVERKKIPASTVQTMLTAACKKIEDDQGFAPGKKARAELKERIVDELTPRALPVRAATLVWIDLEAKMLVIDTHTVGVIDEINSVLLKTESIEINHLEAWPGKVMTGWLFVPDGGDVLPEGYTIDDAVKMEYPGERGTTVTFGKANLYDPAVAVHVSNGAQVIAMAMTFNDRISFTLLPTGQLAGVKPLDIIKDNQVEKDVDVFENDFLLMALELRALSASLIANA
jgi:recombination associated protein RdgC